jgi:hypothetical protein
VLAAKDTGDDYDVFSVPFYNLNSQITPDNYADQYFASLDSLFVPVEFSDMECSESGLMPYLEGYKTHVKVLAKGSTPSKASEQIIEENPDVRGIGLKCPLILSGWGYDENDDPVPFEWSQASGVADSGKIFASGFTEKRELWKTGPLDVRWDDERGVWNAAGGGRLDIRIVDIIGPSGTTYDDLYCPSGAGSGAAGLTNLPWECTVYPDISGSSEGTMLVYNIKPTIPPPNTRFLAFKYQRDGLWYIDNQLTFQHYV